MQVLWLKMITTALGNMMVEEVGTRKSLIISQNIQNLAHLLMSFRKAEYNENAKLTEFLCLESLMMLCHVS